MVSVQVLFVVDDDPAMLEALRRLAASAGLRIETFSSGADFLAACNPDLTGCVLLDLRMPEMNGLEVQARLTSLGITLPIIFLTGHGDVATAVGAMKAGALDFVEKPFDAASLLERILSAFDLDARARARRTERSILETRIRRLSARELEVMELLAAGSSVKVIAAELGVSHKTIQVHRSRILEKLEFQTTAQLIRHLALERSAVAS
jgi:FixJ family two-component response regulator